MSFPRKSEFQNDGHTLKRWLYVEESKRKYGSLIDG